MFLLDASSCCVVLRRSLWISQSSGRARHMPQILWCLCVLAKKNPALVQVHYCFLPWASVQLPPALPCLCFVFYLLGQALWVFSKPARAESEAGNCSRRNCLLGGAEPAPAVPARSQRARVELPVRARAERPADAEAPAAVLLSLAARRRSAPSSRGTRTSTWHSSSRRATPLWAERWVQLHLSPISLGACVPGA